VAIIQAEFGKLDKRDGSPWVRQYFVVIAVASATVVSLWLHSFDTLHWHGRTENAII
jgi:hypothetical protein